jgi:hypothetical protein
MALESGFIALEKANLCHALVRKRRDKGIPLAKNVFLIRPKYVVARMRDAAPAGVTSEFGCTCLDRKRQVLRSLLEFHG